MSRLQSINSTSSTTTLSTITTTTNNNNNTTSRFPSSSLMRSKSVMIHVLNPAQVSKRSSSHSSNSTIVNFEAEKGLMEEIQEKGPWSSSDSKLMKVTGYLRFRTWLTPYRQILIFIVLLNLIGAGFEILDRWSAASRNLSTLVVGHLLAAIAIRSEWVLRLIYWLSIKLFQRSLPVRLRATVVGLIYHIGMFISQSVYCLYKIML